MVLTDAGNVKCWGDGKSLGDGTDIAKNYPVNIIEAEGSVTPLSGIIQISSGSEHACALTNGGNVKCWGDGSIGQLGNGLNDDKHFPVDVISGQGSSTPFEWHRSN